MNVWLAIVSILAAGTAGFLGCALIVSRKIADISSLATVKDPLLQVKQGDEIIASMTLWEWVGRAVITHNLPPSKLDELSIYIDGVEVVR